MNRKNWIGLLIFTLSFSLTANAGELDESLNKIKNYKQVSETLASAGIVKAEQYQAIQQVGFKHVINLIPGLQLKEKKLVESLGLSYAQIPVDWNNPTLADFERFVELLKAYGDDKVFVHCQLNWRASSFVYLYRLTQLGDDPVSAKSDLEAIWHPHDGWDQYIDKVVAHYRVE